MKKIQLKKKDGTPMGDYVPVHERVMYFTDNEAFKGWQLETEILPTPDPEVARIRAWVTNELGQVFRSAHAEERKGDGFINATSHLENAETSAIGRVLGFCNIGIDTGIASYEEVANAVKQQDELPWMNQAQFDGLVGRMNAIKQPEKRKDLVDNAYRTYKVKRDYRRQFEELIENRDIKL